MKVIEIPREETRTVMEYQCPACGTIYAYRELAEICLDRHGGETVLGGVAGDTLTIDDGKFEINRNYKPHKSKYTGSLVPSEKSSENELELDKRVSVWVSDIIDVEVVEDEIDNERYLFQRSDSSRAHVRYRKVLKLTKPEP